MAEASVSRLIRIVPAATLLISLLTMPNPAAAATCTVPGTHGSIQAAVNDGTCSTINVGPGMFFENVTIGRTLTLNGAQAGNPVVSRVSGSPTESTINSAAVIGANPTIKIQAANVLVDGFTVRNALSTGAAIGINVKQAGTGAVIANNFIDTITTLDMSVNSTAQAIYLETGPDDVQILGNDMENIQSLRSAKGVTIGDSNSANPSTNVLIDGNLIRKVTSLSRGAYGVSINNGNGNTANAGLQVTNNTIDTLNGGGWVHAIGLETNTPGVVVSGNSISALIAPPPDLVAVWFEVNPGFATASVNFNNFDVTPAAYGIAVQSTIPGTGAVDGTCNWWGAPNGPGFVGTGAGAMVTPRVDYTPWLNAPAPFGACVGGLPSTPGKVTGGGQVAGADPLFSPTGELLSLPALTLSAATPNEKATFGFSVKCCPESGNLEYTDHGAGVRIKSLSITGLFISDGGISCPAVPGSKHAIFTGSAEVTGPLGTNEEDFTVQVDDCGEPGTIDTFGIDAGDYHHPPSQLIGGNIQIH
jgi:hypothetical protein